MRLSDSSDNKEEDKKLDNKTRRSRENINTPTERTVYHPCVSDGQTKKTQDTNTPSLPGYYSPCERGQLKPFKYVFSVGRDCLDRYMETNYHKEALEFFIV